MNTIVNFKSTLAVELPQDLVKWLIRGLITLLGGLGGSLVLLN